VTISTLNAVPIVRQFPTNVASGQPQALPDVPQGRLGPPLHIKEVARLIGCSCWTVRQTLIPKGLPCFRGTSRGRLIFYQDQVIRWIEKKQQTRTAGGYI
jgi:hypothetical protein